MVSVSLSDATNPELTIEESLQTFSSLFKPEDLRPDGLVLDGLWKGNTIPYKIVLYEFPETGHKHDGEKINYVEFGNDYPWEAVLKSYTSRHKHSIHIGWLLAGAAPSVEEEIMQYCRKAHFHGSHFSYFPLSNGELRYPIPQWAITELKEKEWRSKNPEEIEELYSQNLNVAITRGVPYVCGLLDKIVEDVQKKTSKSHS
jgi:hypothetical protein